MTREEAIYCLQSYQPDHEYSMCVKCKYYESGCKSNEARAMAIEALESQRESAQDVPDTNVGKWIPVSERLPEREGRYLVCFDGKDAHSCYYNAVSTAYWWSDDDEEELNNNWTIDAIAEPEKCIFDILAWQYLPKEYEVKK